MSPRPRVVIQGVFVEQANSVCYLLCSRFISENCIVPPFGEQVMECRGKQGDCHSPGFWWCCTALLRGSHILPVILTLNPTCQHTVCVRFSKSDWKRAATVLYCVRVNAYLWVLWACEKVSLTCDFLCVNSSPLTQSVWWAHSSRRHVLGRQTGGGAYGCSPFEVT